MGLFTCPPSVVPAFRNQLFVKPLKKEVEAEPTRLMGDTEEARPLTPDTTPRLPRRTLPTLFFTHRRLWEKVAGRRQRRARPLPPKGRKAPARVARRMPRPGREGPIPAGAGNIRCRIRATTFRPGAATSALASARVASRSPPPPPHQEQEAARTSAPLLLKTPSTSAPSTRFEG